MYLDNSSYSRLSSAIAIFFTLVAMGAIIVACVALGGCGGNSEGLQGTGSNGSPGADVRSFAEGGCCHVADIWQEWYFECAGNANELRERVRQLEEQLALAEDALRDCQDVEHVRCHKPGRRLGWYKH
jgi:hypothetical protein